MYLFRISLILFITAVSLLQAIEVKTPFMTAELSPRGAVLTSLKVKGKAWICTAQKHGSFTDRILQDITPDLQGLADTAQIIYELKGCKVTPAGTNVTFSSCIGVMPGLRMEKNYFFSAHAPIIKVEYRFKNIGSTPFPLALYTRSFLRSSSGKTFYYHPGARGIDLILPGETAVARKLPSLTFLAAADEKGAGFIQHFPADDTAGVLNWIIKGGYTQEYISSQLPLPPGKTRLIQWECRYADDVKAALKKLNLNSRKLKGGIPVQVDRICRIKPKAKLQFFRTIPVPDQNFIDCTFRRQFDDSWRAVELPSDKKNAPVAVYKVENGVAATDSPLPFFRKEDSIVICVPGISPQKFIYPETCSIADDFVYCRTLKKWYGPVTMKCRILFDGAAQKEVKVSDIPKSGALIRNGSMEISSPKNKKRPAFISFVERRKFQGETATDGSGNKFLRVKKDVMYSFLPEHQKEYHLSFRARAAGGTGLTRVFIQFYDKDGKYLQKERLIVYAGKNSFGWKKFERRFYVPDHISFVRLLFSSGQAEGQYIDIDDLKLTLPVQKLKSVDRKTILRDEMSKHWNIPLELLENISHELVTPHKKWFIPAEKQVQKLLFISGMGTKITHGRRRDIVEFAQRLDMKYTHIPLIRKIKNVVNAYSVYPTTLDPLVSEYTMEILKAIKKLPRTVCFTGVDFRSIRNDDFYKLMEEWQKKGVHFLFHRCTGVPRQLTGKVVKTDFSALLPIMGKGPVSLARICKFTRNHRSLTVTVNENARQNMLVPDDQKAQARYGYATPYGKDYPWWEYSYLLDIQLLRYLSGVRSDAVLKSAPKGCVLVKANKKFKGNLFISIETMEREELLSRQIPVDLPQGGTFEIPDDFELPGGTFVANMQLRDTRNKAVDAGAVKLCRKNTLPITIIMKNKESIVPHPAKAEFSVELPALPAGACLEVELFNQRNEVLFKSARSSQNRVSFAVKLPHLRTFYNYIRAKVTKKGKCLATVTKEFSVPGIPVEMNEFYGFTNPGGSGGAPIKDLEFDFSITGDPRWPHTPLAIRRIRTMGLIPIPRRGDEKLFRPYRGDVKTAPVRTPCFTSPEFHAQLQKDTKYMAENCKFRYNDVNLLWAGDEMFLGRSVCYSHSCLAGFRKKMEKSFKTIKALNENWGTNFKSFAEVMPQQLDELKDKNRLGPWLDHKMYMSCVFAENFFGKAKEELKKYVPNVKIGPTGTQKPGFSYNWHELMKYCRIVGYYSGVQTKVIHDLADGTLMAGQCGGGYTHGHIDYEPYNYNTMWRTLINGGNLAYHYYGCAFKGDGSPTRNLRFYTNSLRELKSGIAKLYLSARENTETAILYSQPSLFAAMGSCGEAEWQNSQTSWVKLLEDLRISVRFINYEDLAAKGVPKGIKAVVLPFALALSDQELSALERFAEGGGTVIADLDAGIFDGHGRRRSAVEWRSKLKFADFLNFSIARYNFVQSGGVGGELSSTVTGDKEFIRKCRSVAGALLKSKGILPFVKLVDAQNNEFGCTAKFRTDGSTRLYGFHLSPSERLKGLFKNIKGTPVKVTLPRKGHIYEVRSSRYLGYTNTFSMELKPGWSMIYAQVPVKPEVLKVEVPQKVFCGSRFKVKAAITPARGPQVFRLTLHSPEGRELRQFSRNCRWNDPSGEEEFFIPFNLAPGKYTLKVRHILSGLTSVKAFELLPSPLERALKKR